jgi:hypothetical protein
MFLHCPQSQKWEGCHKFYVRNSVGPFQVTFVVTNVQYCLSGMKNKLLLIYIDNFSKSCGTLPDPWSSCRNFCLYVCNWIIMMCGSRLTYVKMKGKYLFLYSRKIAHFWKPRRLKRLPNMLWANGAKISQLSTWWYFLLFRLRWYRQRHCHAMFRDGIWSSFLFNCQAQCFLLAYVTNMRNEHTNIL